MTGEAVDVYAMQNEREDGVSAGATKVSSPSPHGMLEFIGRAAEDLKLTGNVTAREVASRARVARQCDQCAAAAAEETSSALAHTARGCGCCRQRR